jgi:AGCS family alanine or glycine:cation symporter
MDFDAILGAIDDVVWGLPLITLIIACGVWLTIRTRCLQVRHLGKALRFMVRNEKDCLGEVTSFGALCTALSATIGTGNIVGVASAITAGGPGALFWMEVAAFFGMATKYSEGLLAVKYRTLDEDGHALGGPFYYIEKGMGANWKWLGKLFALFGVLAGALGIGTITQVNGITSAAQAFFDPNAAHVVFSLGKTDITMTTIIMGLIITVCAALVIIGGLKRIARVAEVIVPFMAIFYVLCGLLILIVNVTAIPDALYQIVVGAFKPSAIAGGVLGATVKMAIQKGVARGIFSNEAGLGSAPIAAAAAQTKEPVRQGLVTMTGTFIDTTIICTMTGLAIVISGAWLPNLGLIGAQVTTYAFQQALPFSPQLVSAHDVPDIFCVYHHSRLGLLCGTLPGIPVEPQHEDGESVSLVIYRRRVHRPIYDGFRRLDHRRYLQRLDGAAQHHCPSGTLRGRSQGNKGVF